MPDLRLLPLLPSASEIVHALGLGHFQVGRSHECDFPEQVRELPVCSEPAIAVDGSSAEIDSLVKERLLAAASIYRLDTARIRSLRPSHIITQTQCKVCAVSLEDVEQAVRLETGVEAQIVPLESYSLAEVWQDIRRVGEACKKRAAAEELVEALRARVVVLEERARRTDTRPRVAAIEWLEPLMAAGNWIPELIDKAGGENLFGAVGQHSPWMSWDEVTAADPDIVVALPCGFDLARTRSEMHWLTGRPGWSRLKAVQTRQVYVCDGNQYMNRPGPRLVESLQIFAEIMHPEEFRPEFEGDGWQRFSG
jgi:iron complex transport system substrate-binding protein